MINEEKIKKAFLENNPDIKEEDDDFNTLLSEQRNSIIKQLLVEEHQKEVEEGDFRVGNIHNKNCPLCALNDENIDSMIFFHNADEEMTNSAISQEGYRAAVSKQIVNNHRKHIYIIDKNDWYRKEVSVNENTEQGELDEEDLVKQRLFKVGKSLAVMESQGRMETDEYNTLLSKFIKLMEFKEKKKQTESFKDDDGKINMNQLLHKLLDE